MRNDFRTIYAQSVRVVKIGNVDDDGPLTYIRADNGQGGTSEWMLTPTALLDLYDLLRETINVSLNGKDMDR